MPRRRRHPVPTPKRPDYIVLAERALYPGRTYHELTRAERVAATAQAIEDAGEAGVIAAAFEAERRAQRAWKARRARELAGLRRAG